MHTRQLRAWLHYGPIVVIGLFFTMVYGLTLLPGLGAGDTAEFQRVAPTLGVAHSTGYPLYTLLGWLWIQVVPIGTLAWRMNAFSLVCGVLLLVLLLQGLRLGGIRTWLALVVVLAFGLLWPVWLEATHAEIYTLALLLLVAVLVAAWLWRAQMLAFGWLGLLTGLALSHHRTFVLWLPGVLVFVLLTRRPGLRQWLIALGAGVLPFGLYAYIGWRAAVWQQPWSLMWSYVLGSSGGDWIQFDQLWAQGWLRPRQIWWVLVIGRWAWPIGLLSLAGVVVLWFKDRALAWLLSLSYLATWLFGSVYIVPDLDPFLLPMVLIHAVWFAALLEFMAAYLGSGRQWLLMPIIGLPLWLLVTHWSPVKHTNTTAAEVYARQRMAQQLPANPVIIGDGVQLESLRYLQAVEGVHGDWQWQFVADPALIEQLLQAERPVFLLEPRADLVWSQQPVGFFWQVVPTLPSTEQAVDYRWSNQIQLTGISVLPDTSQAAVFVSLTLQWQTTTQPAHEFLRFVHLIGPDANIWAQSDQLPAGLAAGSWPLDQAVFDRLVLTLPADAPSGQYEIVTGLYSYPELQPIMLNLVDSDRIVLGSFWVP